MPWIGSHRPLPAQTSPFRVGQYKLLEHKRSGAGGRIVQEGLEALRALEESGTLETWEVFEALEASPSEALEAAALDEALVAFAEAFMEALH